MTAERSFPSPSELRVLAIHAHPDDIEFQCAGTLLRLRELGCQISVATMTPGDCGSAEHTAEEIATIRRAEAGAAAAILGADYTCLEFRDLSICFDMDARRRMCEFIRRKDPHLILTAPPVDYMHDHEITSALVRDACFSASVPNYRTHQWDPAPITGQIPWLYYVDAIEGIDHFGHRQPVDFVVDVTPQFSRKMQALACHASQREWLRRQHGIDEYMQACERWSEARGAQIGVAHGEAFRQYKGHPHPSNNLLGSLLNAQEIREFTR
ncbi:MAG: PIG-L family deacetylase [Planctomycetaceae bacterium]|nr:PIG-L family deacetylase [Planctomycetaceae bacterium]